MRNWIIIDKNGKRRIAKESEIISQSIIDDSELSLEDGDLVIDSQESEQESEVYKNENERKKYRKKNSTF